MTTTNSLTIILGEANRVNGNPLRVAYVFTPDGSIFLQVNAAIKGSFDEATELVLNYVGFRNEINNSYIIKKRALVKQHIETALGKNYHFVLRSESCAEYLKLHGQDIENIRWNKDFKVIKADFD